MYLNWSKINQQQYESLLKFHTIRRNVCIVLAVIFNIMIWISAYYHHQSFVYFIISDIILIFGMYRNDLWINYLNHQ
jgi:hypothetical protein